MVSFFSAMMETLYVVIIALSALHSWQLALGYCGEEDLRSLKKTRAILVTPTSKRRTLW